ncbi:MAG: nucleotidyltransferase family protein, partial [Nitrospirae bacterium]|nr:nucleotidyltransferase family protein [Nitrospirota bacterium]
MNLSNENKLLISCIRDGISRDNPEEIHTLLSSRIKWDEFIDAAISQGIAPMAYKRLKDIPERCPVPLDVRDKLAEIYHRNVARNMYIHSELKRILSVFNENGTDVMLLKGAALSGTVYKDIGLRAMGDIDLLVKPECLPRVKEIMHELDYAAEFGARTEEW